MCAAKAEAVLPVAVFAKPIQAAQCLDGLSPPAFAPEKPAVGIVLLIDFGRDARGKECAVCLVATNQKQIADAAFHELAFDGGLERAVAIVAVSVWPDAVKE